MKLKLSLSLAALLALASCTKEAPYEYVLKEDVQPKEIVFQNSLGLYVASTGASSRTSDVARPYWQGEEKLVRLQFTEKSLQVVEVDREKRFSDNQTNHKLVMEIPIEHHQYKCAENSFGECTNKEESDQKVPWQQRSFFKPDFNSIKVVEKSMLPIELENLFTGGCYAEASEKLLGFEIKPEKINIQVEKTFNANPACLTKLDRLSDITLSQVYHYSIVKLDTIASPNFKPVAYPTEDENAFGFFTTEYTKLDVDNNSTQRDQVVLMNHWNPNRKVIDYHLSKEFNKPENAELKKATKKAVERINAGLRSAGTDMQVKLHDDTNKIPGDITSSMIVLVEDPSAASVLGYGPSVANPLTGEILSARVVMYKGILESYLKYSYEEIRSKKIQEAGKGDQKEKALLAKTRKFMVATPAQLAAVPAVAKSAAQKAQLASVSAVRPSPIVDIKRDFKQIEKSVRNYTKNVADKKENHLTALSKHCLYAPEAVSIDEKVSAGVEDVVQGNFKKWEDLDTVEKEKVIKLLMPSVWIPTLVHELGHNLGLRHNFAGSEDKNNFYSREELDERGISNEISYSSVMDYGASELDVLPDLGKYDIAALRYGYKREVEVVDAKGETQIVPLESTLKKFLADNSEEKLAQEVKEGKEPRELLTLKEYMFCTDESVGANPGCKRFDAGTSYTEIAQNLIEDYELKYTQRNFRNERISFSLMNDITYAERIDYTFDNLRTFFEVRERIKNEFNLADNAAEWESVAFLKDLNGAVKLSAEFFMSVLKTPDASCAFSMADKPNEIIEILPISAIDPKSATCEELQLPEQFKVVGHFGKSFQSRKSRHSDNPYADQIDVRGIWVDKVLATKYLFARTTGAFNFDKYTENYTDIPEVRAQLQQLIEEVATNKAKATVTIRDTNELELVSGVVGVDTFKTHVIPKAIHPMIASIMGVPDDESLFTQTFLKTISKTMQSTRNSFESGREIGNSVRVHQTRAIDGSTLSPEVVSSIVIGDVKYHATKENKLALTLMKQHGISTVLEAVPEEKINEILQARQQGKEAPTEGVTPAEMAIWKIDMKDVESYMNFGMAAVDIQSLIQIFPSM